MHVTIHSIDGYRRTVTDVDHVTFDHSQIRGELLRPGSWLYINPSVALVEIRAQAEEPNVAE